MIKPTMNVLVRSHLMKTGVRALSGVPRPKHIEPTYNMIANLQRPSEVVIDSPKDMPNLINCAQGER